MFAAESCVSRSIAALTLHMQRSIGQAAQSLRARTAEGRRYWEPKRSALRPDPTPLSGGCGWVHPSLPPAAGERQAATAPRKRSVEGRPCAQPGLDAQPPSLRWNIIIRAGRMPALIEIHGK